MNWVFISIIACTISQLLFCRSMKWALLSLLVMVVVRIMFLLRAQGIVFKTKPLWITEAFIVGTQLVLIALNSDGYNFLSFIFYIVVTAIVIGIEYVDDKFYIYTVE